MDAPVPLLGLHEEYHNPGTGTLMIPCKAGRVAVYYNPDAGVYTAYFPTAIRPGHHSFMSEYILDIKLIILDYLSREAGRSETKEVPLPSKVIPDD